MITFISNDFRKKFQGSIHKLDENEIISDISNDNPSNLSNDEENNKRDRSVCGTDKDSDKELDPVQHNTKQMSTYQVGTSNFEVYAPRHIHVGSVYDHKKLQTKVSEYE